MSCYSSRRTHFEVGLFSGANATMEPVIAAASLIAIVEAAAALGKAVITVYRSLNDASEELQALPSQIPQKQSQLKFLVRVHERQCVLLGQDGNSLFPSNDLTLLRNSLVQGQKCLQEMERAVNKRHGKFKTVKYALSEKKSVEKLLRHLRDTEIGLSMLLSMMNL